MMIKQIPRRFDAALSMWGGLSFMTSTNNNGGFDSRLESTGVSVPPFLVYDMGLGDGEGPSGSGMNSSWSKSGSFMRPAFQSALACSIRSFEEETKFQ